MPTALVLGAGRVGSVMAADLSTDFDVTLADRNPAALRHAQARFGEHISIREVDLSDPSVIADLVAPFDIVCGALASVIGLEVLQAIIRAGKNYCDITFTPEDAWELNKLAKEHGVTAVVDMGVAPGMSNLLAGHGAHQLHTPERIDIMVGGLPVERSWPFQYKAGFSPYDVIEEYVRTTRLVEGGEQVQRPALSQRELVEFPGLGTLEAFNTDGLRSLVTHLDVPFMRERTLRYPGHAELMKVLRHIGLFDHTPIQVGDSLVAPIDLLSTLLFPKWTYEEGEQDLTVMRVTVEGMQAGERVRLQWDLYDLYHEPSACTSMSRCTAFPCTTVARALYNGNVNVKGVIVPEQLASIPGMVDSILERLERLGVRYSFTRTVLSSD